MIEEKKTTGLLLKVCCDTSGELYAPDKETADMFHKSILSEFLDIQENTCPTPDFKINIVIHSQRQMERTYNFVQEKLIEGNSSWHPILHILPTNLFFQENHAISNSVPLYAKITDSSIWNHAIVIEETTNRVKEDLQKAIQLIAATYEKGLYRLNICREYADLNARLTQQSFLVDFSGHGTYVSPFLFHSETEMQEKINTEEADIYKYKWRFLLLDDKALQPLSSDGRNTSQERDAKHTDLYLFCKLNILVHRLEEIGFQVGYEYYVGTKKQGTPENDRDTIVIVCTETISQAQEQLKKRKFEIILLDYLLSWKADKSGARNFGYELLSQLKDEKFKNYKIGPHKRLFFMFISAFTTAVEERLREKALFRSEEEWHIGEGACPTNTPYLFLYLLIKLMKKRIKDSGIPELADNNIQEVIKDIYSMESSEEDFYGIRQKANDKFNKVLSLLYHYKALLQDVDILGENIFDTGESVLATDFIFRNPTLGGLLEHLTQLVYLTAFGTIRQWPEMWEEYRAIAAVYGNKVECIEKFILKLKEQ